MVDWKITFFSFPNMDFWFFLSTKTAHRTVNVCQPLLNRAVYRCRQNQYCSFFRVFSCRAEDGTRVLTSGLFSRETWNKKKIMKCCPLCLRTCLYVVTGKKFRNTVRHQFVNSFLGASTINKLWEIWTGYFYLGYLPIPDPGVKKAPNSGSATLFFYMIKDWEVDSLQSSGLSTRYITINGNPHSLGTSTVLVLYLPHTCLKTVKKTTKFSLSYLT